MDCTKCAEKGCRISQPCSDQSGGYLNEYDEKSVQNVTRAASKLVDDGRAGTLNRLEEIAEYARLRGYQKLGVAYCYGMEREAALLTFLVTASGLSLWGIGSAFWGLVVGVLVMMCYRKR